MNVLTEDKEVLVLTSPTRSRVGPVTIGNGAGALGALQPLVPVNDESWISEVGALARYCSPQIHIVGYDEEAAILSNPDVVAAVDAVLPDVEAWESEH